MTTLFAPAVSGLQSRPSVRNTDVAYGGRVFRFRTAINLATINGGAAVTTSDEIQIAVIPAGYAFDKLSIISNVSLGTSVTAIGTSPVHASNGQFMPAEAYGTTPEIVRWRTTTAAASAPPFQNDTPVWMTTATANLPTSGVILVDIYVTKP